MTSIRNQLAVFVKPWRGMQLLALAAYVGGLYSRWI